MRLRREFENLKGHVNTWTVLIKAIDDRIGWWTRDGVPITHHLDDLIKRMERIERKLFDCPTCGDAGGVSGYNDKHCPDCGRPYGKRGK